MSENLSQIKLFYDEAFRSFDPNKPAQYIDVRFYPYVGINHTIRVRDGRVYVRIGEVCREMPLAGQRALAFILVAKLFRKQVPPRARDDYSKFVKSREIREKALVSKRERGRKVVSGAKGAVYDLDEIFDDLNRVYFKNTLSKPVLTWSARRTFRILGHHDSAHETIVISKSLDDKTVPRFVTEYIVFHEMLHIFHPTQHRNGRRYNHTPEFRRNEQKFRFYAESELWIERNVRTLKRKSQSQW